MNTAVVRVYLGDVGRDFIRLLLLVIIWLTLSLRLIIASYQFASFININLALNVLTSSNLQVIRSLQAIHSLQSDCRLPNGGLLLLIRLTLTDVLVKVGIFTFAVNHILNSFFV